MLWIISGPSSVGKSTFIGSERATELTGLPPGSPVIWPADESGMEELGSADAFYHCNILRRRFMNRRGGERRQKRGETPKPMATKQTPSVWGDLFSVEVPKRAVVLVAPKETILERMRQRPSSEESTLRGKEPRRYQSSKWISAVEQIDLADLYQRWCQELTSNRIPYALVLSIDDSFSVIENEGDLASIVNSKREDKETHPVATERGESKYTRDQVIEILAERNFRYHRVDLPYGLQTGGRDRSSTRDLVLPESLEGKSVLDVGSALGYFCFEAETRGAERVVGADLNEDRHRDALLLKDIKGSKVEFILRDVLNNPLEESFDYVLLLNVVHHLTDPMRAMKQLARITKERLVIEFPTLTDEKFLSTLDSPLPPECNQWPLIGVSSMRRGVKQTYVFSSSAIERILMDHDSLFSRIEILESPMPNRAIAVCHKAA